MRELSREPHKNFLHVYFIKPACHTATAGRYAIYKATKSFAFFGPSTSSGQVWAMRLDIVFKNKCHIRHLHFYKTIERKGSGNFILRQAQHKLHGNCEAHHELQTT